MSHQLKVFSMGGHFRKSRSKLCPFRFTLTDKRYFGIPWGQKGFLNWNHTTAEAVNTRFNVDYTWTWVRWQKSKKIK